MIPLPPGFVTTMERAPMSVVLRDRGHQVDPPPGDVAATS